MSRFILVSKTITHSICICHYQGQKMVPFSSSVPCNESVVDFTLLNCQINGVVRFVILGSEGSGPTKTDQCRTQDWEGKAASKPSDDHRYVHLSLFGQVLGQSFEHHRTLRTYTSCCCDDQWSEICMFHVAETFLILTLLPLLVHREAA